MSITSAYDIPLKTWDEQEDMLSNYKNKVTLFINVTTDCGNAPEYRIIEDIYKKYKDRGFEVVAIPTNQFCGEYVVYDEFVNGMNCALDAKNYAESNHGVTYNFSELVNAYPGEPMNEEQFKIAYPTRIDEFPKQLPEGEVPHEIFKYLSDNSPPGGAFMYGNFEKYLVNKNGKLAGRYGNGTLMPRNHEVEYAKKFELDAEDIGYDISNLSSLTDEITENRVGEHFYNKICSDIESLL